MYIIYIEREDKFVYMYTYVQNVYMYLCMGLILVCRILKHLQNTDVQSLYLYDMWVLNTHLHNVYIYIYVCAEYVHVLHILSFTWRISMH